LILADNFTWEEIGRRYDRSGRVADNNIGTVNAAKDRGQAVLRKMGMGTESGEIIAPVNCGLQMYDVVDITDSAAGLSGAKRRVVGLTLTYRPLKAEYRQRIILGGV